VSVRINVTERRRHRPTPSYARTIFTKRLPDLVAPSARHMIDPTAWLTAIGLALGGAAGRRLLWTLGAQ
jgi:hypothetical protein